MQRRILVIEDEDALRELYQEILTDAGYHADAYETGTEGIQALRAHGYDLVLLDIILPDVNGLDVLKTIREDEKIGKTPVILLTNLNQDLIVQKGLALGANGYWLKIDYTPDQVVKAVENVFSQGFGNASS